MWNSFIEGFCKVEMLCYQGDPNWLGWINIGILGTVPAVGILAGLAFIFTTEEDELRLRKLEKEERLIRGLSK